MEDLINYIIEQNQDLFGKNTHYKKINVGFTNQIKTTT